MFPLFHIAVPLIIFEIPYIKKKVKVNRFALIIGAILPDIIDKTLLFIARLGNGRYICHTLFFLFTSFLFLLVFNKLLVYAKISNKIRNAYTIPISFFIGTSIHLLLDLPNIPLFYPFIMYDFTPTGNELLYWLERLFANPFFLSTEIFGLTVFIFIILNNKLYTFKDIWSYLIVS
jgi:hypothetical protein